MLVITISNLKNLREDSWDSTKVDPFFVHGNCIFRYNFQPPPMWDKIPFAHMHNSWSWQRKANICSFSSPRQPCELLFISSPFSPDHHSKEPLKHKFCFSFNIRQNNEVMRTCYLPSKIWYIPTAFLIIFQTAVIPELIQPIQSLDRLKLIQEERGKHSRWHTMFHPLNA